MAHGKVTMTDIARAAGCSQATVSLVLNDVPHSKISNETRLRVIRLARKLKYGKTSRVREKIAKAGPQRIGFIVDRLTSEMSALAEAVGAAYWETETVVLVVQTMNEPARLRVAIDALSAAGADGLMVVRSEPAVVVLPEDIGDAGAPVVLVNCSSEDDAYPHVPADDFDQGSATLFRDMGAAAALLLQDVYRITR